jgi:prevent-host-death family protein
MTTRDHRHLPLSDAKARLSEVIREVRRTGRRVVITVDGEPAVELIPAVTPARKLSPREIAVERALLGALDLMERNPEPFDAVELVREGRR